MSLEKLMDDYSSFSSLAINPSKSKIIFSGSVANRNAIMNALGMTGAKLPISYLGLHLFSARMHVADYAD